MNIEEIVNTPVVGSFGFDQELWDACSEFILNENNPINERILALKKIDEITGIKPIEITEKDIELYVKETKELLGKK
jgi:hypothetical protein